MSVLTDITGLRARASAGGHMPVRGRPAVMTLTLGPDWTGLPAATELASLLLRVPVAGVRFVGPVDLSALPGHVVVRVIALLRECSSTGARVSWSIVLGPEQLGLIQRLDHLPAPDGITVTGRTAPSAREWRSSSGFGLFHFRKGPGFLVVSDQRPESRGRLVVDDPAMTEVFFQGLEGCTWAQVTGNPRHAAAAHALADKGVLLRIGDHCVVLPVHLRSWPLGAALLGGTLASAGKKKDG